MLAYQRLQTKKPKDLIGKYKFQRIFRVRVSNNANMVLKAANVAQMVGINFVITQKGCFLSKNVQNSKNKPQAEAKSYAFSIIKK